MLYFSKVHNKYLFIDKYKTIENAKEFIIYLFLLFLKF